MQRTWKQVKRALGAGGGVANEGIEWGVTRRKEVDTHQWISSLNMLDAQIPREFRV
jgi:hypothetical protein